MDEFGNDIISKVKWDQIQKIQVHGVIGEIHKRNLVDSPVVQIKLWNSQMMYKRVPADRRHPRENSDADHQGDKQTPQQEV